jgi:predicted MFS family arabinose efflux permease
MGIRQTGLPLGGVAAATVLPPVAAAWGWRAGVGLAAFVAAVGGVAFGVLYRESPAAEPAPQEDEGGMASRVRALVHDRSIRGALWAGVALASLQFCLVAYLMLFLRDGRGVPLVRGAWVLVAAQGAGVVGRIVLGALSDRRGPGRRMAPVVVSLALSAVGVAALPLVPAGTDLWTFAALAGVIGFFGFGWYGPWVAHVAEAGPAGSVGITLGLAMTANQVGIVAAPPLFGLLVDATGTYGVAWWTLAGALTAVTPVVALGRRWRVSGSTPARGTGR